MNKSINIGRPSSAQKMSYRFDIFKGSLTASNVKKAKSVGAAILLEGQSTYTVYLNTFINEVYYLLPGSPRFTTADYVIMSRQKATRPGKKFVWRPVGEGRLFQSETGLVLRLSWDLFDGAQLFMNMTPNTQSVEAEMVSALREVLKA